MPSLPRKRKPNSETPKRVLTKMKKEGLTMVNQVKRNRDSSDKAFKVMASECNNGSCKYKFIKFGSKASEKVRNDSAARRKRFRSRFSCDSKPKSALTATRWACDSIWVPPNKSVKNS